MHEEPLQDIGLSPNEARVYEALLPLGEANVSHISKKSGVHRRNVYDSLYKLVDRGLVSQYVVDGEKHFQANKPERLMTLLDEKKDKLADAIPDLQDAFASHTEEEEAYIYRGIEGFRNYMQDIIDVGEDFYSIGAKGGWFDPRLETFRKQFYREFEELEINAYHIFDHEMRDYVDSDTANPTEHHLPESRFFPPDCSTNAAIDFFGDRVVTFTGMEPQRLDEDLVQFVLKSRELCQSYEQWFWYMWEHAEPP